MASLVSVISFTEKGIQLSKKLAEASGRCPILASVASESVQRPVCVCVYRLFCAGSVRQRGSEDVHPVRNLSEWTGGQFAGHHGILFIGACGIAVRCIAPYIQGKQADSPVLVMDEEGRYVIPILSGHLGGANRLAKEVAALVGGEVVLTTATDVNKKFAVDVFAAEHGFAVQNKDGIEKISAAVLRGEKVKLFVEESTAEECRAFLTRKLGECPSEIIPVGWTEGGASRKTGDGSAGQDTDGAEDINGAGLNGTKTVETEGLSIVISEREPLWHATIWLRPKSYVLGMGCRKGKEFANLSAFVKKELSVHGILEEELYGLASIEKKREETGILELADYFRIPFYVYTEETLAALAGEYSASEFVAHTVGVDNVCERAVAACCGAQGEIILRKIARDGMTLALGRRDWRE